MENAKQTTISSQLFSGKVKLENQTNSNHIFQPSVHYSKMKSTTENPGLRLSPHLSETVKYLKGNKQLCEQRCKRKEKCPFSCLVRIKRSESSIKRKRDFKFFDFEESGIEIKSDEENVEEFHYTAMPVIQAHGVGGPELGEEGHIFLSANNTVVETHKGTDTTLNCRIARDSDYGTVIKTQ